MQKFNNKNGKLIYKSNFNYTKNFNFRTNPIFNESNNLIFSVCEEKEKNDGNISLQNLNENENNEDKSLYDLGIEWKDLDLSKFMVIGSTFYLLESLLIYPFDLVRTQLQVDTGKPSLFKDTFIRAKTIVQTKGTVGLFRGFWFSTLSSLPSNVIYILSYNYCKHVFDKIENANRNPSEIESRGHAAWVLLSAGATADVISHLFYGI